MTFSFNAWQILGLILASGLLWMLYVRSKDRHQPEPSRRLLFAFVLGIGAFWLSLLGYFAVESLGVPDIKFNERHWTAVYCFGIVGPLEEGAKVLVAYPVVFRWRE
jgi:RsiW-degrading membrane proteinase PrsW (M82 family)